MILGLRTLTLRVGCVLAAPSAAMSALTYRTQATEPVLYGVTEFGTVRLVLDKDHNQLPDSFEETYELDPGSTAADADDDGDGLVNKTELAYGTDPSMADTDGDSVSDGAEVENGSSPLDRSDTASTAIPLVSILVEPRQSRLTYNTVYSPPTLDLRVTALLADDTTRDVTDNVQTTYVSVSPAIATVSSSGRVTALANGTAQIIAQYRGRTDIATVTITTFLPKPVAALGTAGFAYRVAVHAGVAYVANGSAGLWVIDVQDPTSPQQLTQVTLGNNDARDVALSGDWAVIANGIYGIAVVDISDPNSASLRGRLDLAGEAQGLAVQGQYAYVAAGLAGLIVVDLSNSTAPSPIASLALDGNTRDLALDSVLHRVVVADDTGAVHLVDISDVPAVSPALLGTLAIPGGEPKDVALRGVLAWVAAEEEKVWALDVGGLGAPEFEAQITTGGLVARGVDVAGSLLFVADWGFVNTLPIYSVPSTSSLALIGEPALVGQINFSGDADHQGVAVAGGFVYVAVGDDGLQIGQYAQFNDAGHVAPRVAITHPDPGTSWVAGDPVTVTVQAQDDVAVASFELLWDDNVVATLGDEDDAAPTRQVTVDISAPPAASVGGRPALLGARARDLNGNVGEASPVDVFVMPPNDLTAPTLTVMSPENGSTIAGGRAFLITVEATDDHGIAYVEVEDEQGIVRDRDYDEPYELVGVMPYEGVLDETIPFTVRAVDYSERVDSETVSLVYGGFSDEVVDSCALGVPVFELPEEGISGSTTGQGLFSGSCAADAGEPERIFAYTVAPSQELRSLTFSTDDPLTNFDTVLHVRFGSCANPDDEIDCDDQSGGNNTSQVTISYPEAGIYYVFVDGSVAGAAPGEGAFKLNVSAEGDTGPVSFSHVPSDAVWATTVLGKSSQYSSPGYSAEQALGSPDTCACGDSTTAWSPYTRDGSREWISVAFNSVAVASGVYVHETSAPGAVVEVEISTSAADGPMDWNQVYSGAAAAAPCDRWILYPFEATSDVQAVRLTLDSVAVSGWNEIDAIGLKVPSDDFCGTCSVDSSCVMHDWGGECVCSDGYMGGGPTCVPIAEEVVLGHPPSGSDVVWPSATIGASSYYHSNPPAKAMTWDTCTCADSSSAWSPNSADSSTGEWIAMTFPDTMGPAWGVIVRENMGTGSIVGVDVATTETPAGGCYSLDWEPIFEQNASLGADCPRWVLYPLPGIDLRAVRLRLDTATIPSWNEIEAVAVMTSNSSDCIQGCDSNAICADGYTCTCNEGYVGDGRLCVPEVSAVSLGTATPTDSPLWATGVVGAGASTQYYANPAERATGAPNVTSCADSSSAWSPSTASRAADEWIAVSFPASQSSGVYVHETLGAGAIVGVDVAFAAETNVCGDADWHPVYAGQPDVTATCPRWVLYSFSSSIPGVAAVRLRLDTEAIGHWQEIDAIGLKP